MTYLTSNELALLRSQPHRTKLYLSVYNPTTVFAAHVQEASKNSRYIPYEDVSSGSYLNIKSGMTLYVGTTAGGNEKGSIRLRSADASELLVAENSHIYWEAGDYLTVVSFFEITAVYPRIILNPDEDLGTLWYKDYDIEYTDQNSVLGTFICMGPHYAGFTGDQVYYSATGTHNLKAEAMTYSWHFEGGTPTGSSSSVPGYVTYNTPGHYTTSLTVTTAGGANDVSYRHVSIYDRPENGVNIPILKWDLEQLNGAVEHGGYSGRIVVRDNVDKSKIRDGALVVIFSEDWYGDIKQSIGGNALNRNSIVFTGYIQQDTIQWNYQDGYVSFDIVSPTEIMKLVDSFSISVQSTTNPVAAAETDDDIPSAWVAVQNLDVRRAIYHYLRWHSTALLCNDFQFTPTDYPVQYFNSNRESLFDAIASLMESGLIGHFGCDRQGKMWAVPSADSINNYETALLPASGLTYYHLDSSTWMENPIIDERLRPQLSYLELGGVAFYGPVTGTYQALLSAAPGLTPNYGGSVERIQGLILESQGQLNTLTGNVYAHRNARYPMAQFELAGNFRNFDIFPLEATPISVQADNTPRGISFSSKFFSPISVTWEYSSEKEFFHPTVVFTELTSGFVADTITIPPIPPTEPEGGGDLDQPPIIVPPLPPPVIPPILGLEYWYCRYDDYLGSDEHTMEIVGSSIRTNSTSIVVDGTSTVISSIKPGLYLVNVWITSRHLSDADDSVFYVDVKFRPCAAHLVGEGFNSGDVVGPDAYSYINGRSRFGSNATAGYWHYASVPLSFPVIFPTNITVFRLMELTINTSATATTGASILITRYSDDICNDCDCEQPSGG